MIAIFQIVFFSISSYRFKYGSEDIIDAIKHNLETPMVTAVYKRQIEPLWEPAFAENWPGTHRGCNCLKVQYCRLDGVRIGRLARGSCNYNETRCGCSQVADTPARSFLNLGGSEFNRFQGNLSVSFKDVYKDIDSSGKCSGSNVLCTRFNDPDFSFCTGKSCPLTDLQITDSSENPNKSLYDDQDYIQSAANTFLWYSNKGTNGPLTDLKISQQFPCFDSRFVSWNKERPDFELNFDNVRECNQDPRYQDLKDRINERLLFSLNDASHKTIDLIDSSDPEWSKYARPVFPLKNSCRQQTEDILEARYSFRSLGRVCMILAIIFSSIQVIPSVLEMLFYCTVDSYNFKRQKNYMLFFGSVKMVWIITLLLLCYYSKKDLTDYTKFIEGLVASKCSDAKGNQLLQDFKESSGFDKIFGPNFWLLWSSLTADLIFAVSRLALVGAITLRK